MLKTVRRSVIIKRLDAGRRVVFGEVMIPAPDVQPGQTVAASELDGRIHFDGAFMTDGEIVGLIDRFATKRPSVDIEHNGIPVAATVVESFQARAGDPEYHVGAWVAGVKIHDPNVWERIDRGELRAFSIQFLVRVEEVPIRLVLDDGAVKDLTLFRFTNGDPQFLSLVHRPATGALWQRVDRSWHEVLRDVTDSRWLMLRKVVRFQDLPLVDDRERAWDGDAAKARMFDAAGGDDLDPAAAKRGFVWVDDEDPTVRGSYKLPIGDIVDGTLSAVPRAVFAAAAALQGARGGVDIPDEDVEAARAHLASYYAKMRAAFDDDSIVPPWETERQEKGEDEAERQEDDDEIDEEEKGKGKKKRADETDVDRSEDEGKEKKVGAIMRLVRRALGLPLPDGREKVTREIKEVARGDKLAALLNGAIDKMVSDDVSRADVVKKLAEASNLSASTINQILRAEINCLNDAQAGQFAGALTGASKAAILSAQSADGCSTDRCMVPRSELLDDTTVSSRAEVFADYLEADAASLRSGIEALFITAANILDQSEGATEDDLERMRAAMLDFAQWGSTQLDEAGIANFMAGLNIDTDDDKGDEADTTAVASEDGNDAGAVERAATSFTSAIKQMEMGDQVWRGTMTLLDTLQAITMAEDLPDKPSAMRQAAGEFHGWLIAQIDAMAAQATLSTQAFDPDNAEVGRKGKKIKGARLKKLKDLKVALEALISELDDVAVEDEEKKKRAKAKAAEGDKDEDEDEDEDEDKLPFEKKKKRAKAKAKAAEGDEEDDDEDEDKLPFEKKKKRDGAADDAGEGDAQEPEQAARDAETASDDGAGDPPDAAEVDRSAEGGDAADGQEQQSIDRAQLLAAFQEMTAHNEALEERIRSLESARPPASNAGGTSVDPGAAATPYDKVQALLPVFFPDRQ